MRLAKGPRPWTIWVFAAAFLGAALLNFVSQISNLETVQKVYELQMPWEGWSRDWTIVAVSARLSIALIPIALIVFSAVRFARWLVTALAVFNLLELVQKIVTWMSVEGVSLQYLAEPALIVIAGLCLWSPSAERYFAQKEPVDASIFE